MVRPATSRNSLEIGSPQRVTTPEEGTPRMIRGKAAPPAIMAITRPATAATTARQPEPGGSGHGFFFRALSRNPTPMPTSAPTTTSSQIGNEVVASFSAATGSAEVSAGALGR